MRILWLHKIFLLVAGLYFILALPACAEHVRAGIWNAPPYVMTDVSGKNNGFTSGIWENVARQTHLSYSYALYNDPDELIKALQQGDIDVVVGPMTATADRAEKVAFSQPYYNSSIGIMMQTNPPTLWDRIRPFLTAAFSTSVVFFLMLLVIVGTILWFVERGQNPAQFPAAWVKGVGNGIWLALSVFTTVGFGDIVPRSRAGKVVCSLWMIFTMLLASVITAGLATVLTSIYTLERLPVCSYNDPAQLSGKHVAVIQGTYDDRLVHQWGGRVIYCDSMEKAVSLLERGNVDAIVHVRMSLIYYQATHPEKRLAVSTSSFDSEYLAFAFRLESSLTNRINSALLKMKETGKLNELLEAWTRSLKGGHDYREPVIFTRHEPKDRLIPGEVKHEPLKR